MLTLNMDAVGVMRHVSYPIRSRGGQPQSLKEGSSMPGSVHLSSVLLVSLLVFSTHVLWAQRTSTVEETAVQLPDAPSQVAKDSEAQTRLHFSYKGSPLSFTQKQGQTESYRWSVNAIPVLNQDGGTAEFWRKNKYFMGSAPAKWMTFAPTFGPVHHETIHGANDLEYYGHHMPWAGSVILRISQQAKAHPHIATVLKAVHPRF